MEKIGNHLDLLIKMRCCNGVFLKTSLCCGLLIVFGQMDKAPSLTHHQCVFTIPRYSIIVLVRTRVLFSGRRYG